ncbi:phosphoribosyl-aminoimidazole-succinocarboxamide synthase [Mytilinidion resinicola]|uniref:Phosphoribosylaminoimidazole-succinocarboxamide synthase n=1 Tax=Mytilinidion resinicola TaxID=574789 RepID=A0A6A6XYS6_9PEZI|nr:phosphoribosyl-aminoimidazole-succinocarboxamide synthase [Mytilinidion resinicola]KAF2801570.1 phosphoribosyl-aminoimidazole-succinocarboxamide synthase [Mytilinidion resinicola]
MSTEALVSIDLQGKLKRIASGKVRDVFEIDDETLLFVASDRISAYDVIMKNGIPQKGALLTAMSANWFTYLSTHLPSLRTHIISFALPASLTTSLPQETVAQLAPRSMLVRRHTIYPLESIVRGYITGSAWAEYTKSQTVHGIPLPAGLREGDKFPEPLWTPSTKAEQGDKDENISPARAVEIVGQAAAYKIRDLSLTIYKLAAERALAAGIVLADTKFEFGAAEDGSGEVVLVDEVLTPDSSRFWPREGWEANLGKAQPSFDKQFLRDWLVGEGLKGREGVEVPQEVVSRTAEKYRQAYEMITGEKWV